MFAGHLGVALAAKKIEPKAPLGALVAATFGLDLIWPIFLLLRVESMSIEPGATAVTPLSFDWYPWSHSLVMALVWAAVAFGIMRAFRAEMRSAGIVSAVVVSHWFLDFLTHRPDLPLWPGGPQVGLGLWHSVAGTLIIEGALFLGSVYLYAKAFPPKDRRGTLGFVFLVAFVFLIWISGPFAGPPPNADAVMFTALAVWIFPFWAWWIETHRQNPGSEATRNPGRLRASN